MTVTPVNDVPLANNDDTVVQQDSAANGVDVLANDSNPDGDPLSITTASAAQGSVEIADDGTLVYIPNAGFAGVDTIGYTISDGHGETANAMVSVLVTALPDPPIPTGFKISQTN